MAVARVTKEEIRLMVEKMDGSILVVTVPEGCKVTFGAFQMASAAAGGRGQWNEAAKPTGNAALRIYEGGEGVQLACIPDVKRYQALDKLKVERYTGETTEIETPETWASQSKIGQLGQLGQVGKPMSLVTGKLGTAYVHSCTCGYAWGSQNPNPNCPECNRNNFQGNQVSTQLR